MRPGRWTAVHRPIYWNNYGIQSGRCDVIGDRRPRPLVGDVYPPLTRHLPPVHNVTATAPVHTWLTSVQTTLMGVYSFYLQPLFVHFLIVNLFVCPMCRYCFSTATCFYTPPPLLQPSRPQPSLIVTNLINRKKTLNCLIHLYLSTILSISLCY